jgi:hypothetical protein
MIDLTEINRRYDRVCDLDRSAQTHGAAIAYALDVPALIGEVKRLRKVAEALPILLRNVRDHDCDDCNEDAERIQALLDEYGEPNG